MLANLSLRHVSRKKFVAKDILTPFKGELVSIRSWFRIRVKQARINLSTNSMKTRFQQFQTKGMLAVGLMIAVSGCETTTKSPSPQATVKAPELPAPPPPAGDSPSTLTYGMVTGRVKKGATTQQEIIELFGGPTTMTTDKDGTEVWMYDKTTSTVSGSSAQSGSQAGQRDANAMAVFLGIPFLGGIAGGKSSVKEQSAQVNQGTSTYSRTSKTITFILKFNADKTVKDYSVRQSNN